MNLSPLTNAIGAALGVLHLPNMPEVMPFHRVLSWPDTAIVGERGRLGLARLPLPTRPGDPVLALPIGAIEVRHAGA